MIRGQLEKALPRVLLLPNARPLSLKEHVSIVNAIKGRDPDAARQLRSLRKCRTQSPARGSCLRAELADSIDRDGDGGAASLQHSERRDRASRGADRTP